MSFRFPKTTALVNFSGLLAALLPTENATTTSYSQLSGVPVAITIRQTHNGTGGFFVRQIIKISTWLSGTREATGYYSYSGRLSEVMVWENGSLLKRMVFSTQGSLLCSGTYRANYLHGPYKAPKFAEGNYNRGKPHGLWKFYHYGFLRETCHYKNGILHGYITHYWLNGKKRCRLHILNGRAHGWATYWNKDGSHAGKRKFRNGLFYTSRVTKNNGDEESLSAIRLLFGVDNLRAKDYDEGVVLPRPDNVMYGIDYQTGDLGAAVAALHKLEEAYVNPSTNAHNIHQLAGAVV